MPVPLRAASSVEQGPQSPEALLISSLLELGEFDLARWRIDPDDFSCYQQLVRFCAEHQEHTGQAPAIELVTRKYPDFELTPKVQATWAAGQLRKAVADRELRERIHNALEKLNDEDVENAYAAFDQLQPPLGTRREPLDGFDFTGLESAFDSGFIKVPYPVLGRASGGIKPAELWYLAARTGAGKTNVASRYAAEAIQQGSHVAVWSLEIPSEAYNRRIRRALAAKSKVPGLLKLLDSQDQHDVKEALDTLRETVPGSFRSFDPSFGRCTVEAVRAAMEDADLVIVDHVGLMVTRDGKRAIDDWRVMATISNRLKEETLRTSIPCFGVAQINRAGETSPGSLKTPKLSELSQADALGQDGDVVITMSRYTKHAMLHEAVKVRTGPSVKWFSMYDPAKANYDEIRRERADALTAIDNDAESRMIGDL